MPSLTHDVTAAVELLGAPSNDWLIVRLRSGRLPGRKIGRTWRMTDQDIEDALDLMANGFRRQPQALPGTPVSGLTPTSRKRIVRL